MNQQKEQRNYQVKEFRAEKREDGQTVLTGYSAVFDSDSENLGWGEWNVREKIRQGAFAKGRTLCGQVD